MQTGYKRVLVLAALFAGVLGTVAAQAAPTDIAIRVTWSGEPPPSAVRLDHADSPVTFKPDPQHHAYKGTYTIDPKRIVLQSSILRADYAGGGLQSLYVRLWPGIDVLSLQFQPISVETCTPRAVAIAERSSWRRQVRRPARSPRI